MAAGTARLGLKSGLITRVGDEHMGRFIRETLAAEGVDTRGVVTDPERLTALVILGIRDQERFPLIFYRENCADMALCEDDIDPALIADTRAVVATGTHLSHPRTEAAVLKALAPRARARRPHRARHRLPPEPLGPRRPRGGRGALHRERRRHRQAPVDAPPLRPDRRHRGGVPHRRRLHRHHRRAARRPRRLRRHPRLQARRRWAPPPSPARSPTSLDDGERGPGFPIEVFNVLGAGDGFMSGLLKGWLTDQDWPTAPQIRQRLRRLRRLAPRLHPGLPLLGGAAVLPRPRRQGEGAAQGRRARADPLVDQPPRDWPEMRVFAFDHRMQLEEVADELGAPHDRIGAFKQLCLEAARAGRRRPPRLRPALRRPPRPRRALRRRRHRPLDRPPGRGPGHPPAPARESSPTTARALAEWPLEHVVKVLGFYHPDDDAGDEGRPGGDRRSASPAPPAPTGSSSCSRSSRPRSRPVTDTTSAEIIQRFYDLGVYPDWWKLEPMKTDAAWANACAAITRNDPYTRGIVVLGLEAPTEELAASFAVAARHDLVKGFAVGRTIFADAARGWLGGAITDARGRRGHGREIRPPLPHLGRGARRAREPPHEDDPTDRRPGDGPLPPPPAQRGRRAVPRRLLGDLRPRQRRRHRRGAPRRRRRLPDLARPQRAGHGPRRHRLRQGAEPQARDGRHHLDRPRRAQPRHRLRPRPRQPPAGAVHPRRRLRQPRARPGACSSSRTSTTAP